MAVLIAMMAVLTAGVVWIDGVGEPGQVLYATARAVLQLAVVAASVDFVLRSFAWARRRCPQTER